MNQDVGMIQSMQLAYQRHLASKDAVPVKIPLQARFLAIYSFERTLQDTLRAVSQAKPGSGSIATTFTGFEKSFSSTSLEQLDSILLKDLFLHKVHKRSFVLGRIISRPNRMVSPSFLIEDIQGSVVMVSIYNDSRIGNHQTGQALDALYPLGSIIAIREPYFKLSGNGVINPQTSSGFIRIDAPSDLIFLPSTSPLLRDITWSTSAARSYSPSDYRALGDEFYKKKDYTVAEFLFTQAIEATPVDSTIRLLGLYRNRSMAALSAGNFATSTRDCKKMLEMLESGTPVPKNDPALLENTIKRLANAQYGQRKFSAALSTFDRLAKEFPLNGSGKLGVGRCQKRLEESRTGNYDWAAIELEELKADKPNQAEIDVGDYFHPDIEIEMITGRGGGRGVFAKKSIKAGELLVVEKAFVVGRPGEANALKAIHSINFITNQADTGGDIDVIRKLCGKARDDPSLRIKIINSLFAGAEFGQPTEARIPRATDQEAEEELDSDGKIKMVDIDVSRLEVMSSMNRFGLGTRLNTSSQDQVSSPSALFAVSSLFNHSCISNSTWINSKGDLMVIRAATDIQAGEEIMIQYINGITDCATKADQLRKHFGPDGCNCPLCDEEKKNGITNAVKRREGFTREVEAFLARNNQRTSASTRVVAKKEAALLERLIDSINSTYNLSRIYKPDLFLPNHNYSLQLSSLGFVDRQYLAKSIQAAIKAFESIGLVVEKKKKGPMMIISGTFSNNLEQTIELSILITSSYKELNDIESMKAWLSTSKELERFLSGKREKGYFEKKNLKFFRQYGIDSLL